MTRTQKLQTIKEIKKHFGWTNRDLAEMLNTSESYIKNCLSPAGTRKLPGWVDGMLILWKEIK